tara:strand:- start:527 stop:877 length:351 start_codon:yes stop_codon:yes gene_type:complete
LIQPLLLFLVHLKTGSISIPNITIQMFAVFITHLSDFSKFPNLILNLDQTMVFALLPDEDPVGFIFLSPCSGSEKYCNTKPRNSQPNKILKKPPVENIQRCQKSFKEFHKSKFKFQ